MNQGGGPRLYQLSLCSALPCTLEREKEFYCFTEEHSWWSSTIFAFDFYKSQPQSPSLCSTLGDEMRVAQKALLLIRKDSCLQGRRTGDHRRWKMSYPLFHETLYVLERTTTNYDYSGLDIWQTFPPRKKRACHIKENNPSSLLPMIKFELSNFRKLILPPWMWQLPKTERLFS